MTTDVWGNPKWDRNEPVVPFRNDEMLTWPGRDCEWRLLKPFYGQMQVLDFYHGRSAMTFRVQDTWTMLIYPITLKTMFAILMKYNLMQGLMPALEWRAMKVGSNYQLQLNLTEE